MFCKPFVKSSWFCTGSKRENKADVQETVIKLCFFGQAFALFSLNLREGNYVSDYTWWYTEADNLFWTQMGHYGTSKLTVSRRRGGDGRGGNNLIDDKSGTGSMGFVVVPMGRDVTIQRSGSSQEHEQRPVYWKLPSKFNGDRILSYNGYVRSRL